jgi:nucleotide-binding universal stress UspA family protein
MYQHILLPVDGSPLSEMAARHCLTFARETGAQVTAYHARPEFQVITYRTEMLSDSREAFEQDSQAQAQRVLKFVTDKAEAEGVRCKGITTVTSHPWQGILQTANEQGCDLVFMASHGRRGVAGLLLGSETQKVLTHSKIPVLVQR